MPANPIFRIRLDHDRRDRWAKRAQAVGTSLSRFVRQCVDHAVASEADPGEVRRELAGIRRELNAIGVNLNQIAVRMNSEMPVAEDELHRELNQLRAARRQITEVLHRR